MYPPGRDKSPGPSVSARGVLPHSSEAEAAILGGILLRNEVFKWVADHLTENDFYHPQNQLIYGAMNELEAAGQPIDPITLEEELSRTDSFRKAGGMDYLVKLTEQVPTAENILYYVKIVADKSMVRRLIRASTEIASSGYGDYGDAGDYLDAAEQSIFEITQEKRTQSYVHLKPVLQTTFRNLEVRQQRAGTVTGVPTGFTEFDEKTGGMQAGQLVILAARPSMGKTALALNMCAHAAVEHQVPVIFFSLEMTKEQLVERMLCCDARVNSDKVRKGQLGRNDWEKLTEAASNLYRAPLYLDDNPQASLRQVRNRCRRFRSDKRIFPPGQEVVSEEQALGLIVVDYLQLMSSAGEMGRAPESREREISEISRGLKGLAKELRMPVLALSQLNRQVESRENKRPKLADLRESGAIEQDADLIAFIYRDEVYNKDTQDKGMAEVLIEKQRAGPTFMTRLAFLGEFTRFENLSSRPEPTGY